jgi:DNA-binding NarL/FixJ family response regulator
MMLMWRQLGRTRSDLVEALVEAEQWKKESNELIEGLGAAIERQFERWQLTNAEAEVGLFLLKGLSHKEIAEIRQTSERTVREQSRALYRKSGLSGRSSLSAFFLEDLLLPHIAAD